MYMSGYGPGVLLTFTSTDMGYYITTAGAGNAVSSVFLDASRLRPPSPAVSVAPPISPPAAAAEPKKSRSS